MAECPICAAPPKAPCVHGQRLLNALDAPAAPDRPGDRDQRQAEIICDCEGDTLHLSDCPTYIAQAADRKTAEHVVARIVARPWREQRDVIAAALAAARAEEAARWRAKIETLAAELELLACAIGPQDSDYDRGHNAGLSNGENFAAYRLRAVLDES